MNSKDKLKFIDDLTIVYQNSIQLLLDRGYSDDTISVHTSNELLSFKIQRFIEENKSSYIDISVYQENKTYIKFFLGEPYIPTKIKFKLLEDEYNFIKNLINMDESDEIIFVFVTEKISDDENNILRDFEIKYQNVRTFHYKSLFLNISRHKLVPKHILYNDNEDKLLNILQIKNKEQLPYILHQDPICKYYNFKLNQIVKIIRPSIGNKSHIVYRVVKNESTD